MYDRPPMTHVQLSIIIKITHIKAMIHNATLFPETKVDYLSYCLPFLTFFVLFFFVLVASVSVLYLCP